MRYLTDACGKVFVDSGLGFSGLGQFATAPAQNVSIAAFAPAQVPAASVSQVSQQRTVPERVTVMTINFRRSAPCKVLLSNLPSQVMQYIAGRYGSRVPSRQDPEYRKKMATVFEEISRDPVTAGYVGDIARTISSACSQQRRRRPGRQIGIGQPVTSVFSDRASQERATVEDQPVSVTFGLFGAECCPAWAPYSNPIFGECCPQRESKTLAKLATDFSYSADDCTPPSPVYCPHGGDPSRIPYWVMGLIGFAALSVGLLTGGAGAALAL